MFRPSILLVQNWRNNHEILQYTAPGRAGDIPEIAGKQSFGGP